ncbi:MAG: cyclic nucleotide-binding domain-containing protein [Clostridiales bacterium]|nr:cyclic nucleotide-binding domain-containing protein [Clostridiales bacterium]
MIKQQLKLQHINVLKEYGLTDIDTSDIYIQRYERGEFIYYQGNTFDHLFFFLEGKAKVFYTSENGKTLLIAFYTTKGIIGEAELMSDRDTAALGIQAITEVICIAIPMVTHKEYLKNNLDFMNCVGKELSDKLFVSTSSATFNVLHTLKTRLLAYIAMTHQDGYFNEKLTDLSEILGTSYRHLHRTLVDLCNQGLLGKRSKGYQIIDVSAFNKTKDRN